MKTVQRIEMEVEVKYIKIDIAVRYDEEDIPYDFPLRDLDMWIATVDIDTGQIQDWPTGIAGNNNIEYMKVCDQGIYTLLSQDMKAISKLSGYVPHGVVPGEFGDYVTLHIGEDGIISNWPKKPDVSAFFEIED